MSGSL